MVLEHIDCATGLKGHGSRTHFSIFCLYNGFGIGPLNNFFRLHAVGKQKMNADSETWNNVV